MRGPLGEQRKGWPARDRGAAGETADKGPDERGPNAALEVALIGMIGQRGAAGGIPNDKGLG
jgi:hypothetical protein